MSYELCKSITKKENKIILNVASSNVFPKHYNKWEYNITNDLKKNEFYLFTDIISGNIHLNNSIYNYNYAMIKVREYMKENNIDSYNDLYEKKNDYYNKKIKELIGIDLTSDYYKDKELVNEYNEFRTNNTELVEQLRYDSYYKVYGNLFDIYMKALEEKEDNTIYTLYSQDYRSFIKCGRNGNFWYGYASAKEKGKYKEMYCKMKNIDRKGVEIQRLVLTDKEIQKELENQELEQQAKTKIKDLEQVKKDLESFNNYNYFEIDRYYLKELCKLYNIKINIPKNLIYITKSSYSYKGKGNSYKTSENVRKIREQLLEKVGA